MRGAAEGDSSSAAVLGVFEGIQWAASSDYKLTKDSASKTVTDALLVFDRITQAGGVDLLDRARVDFGPKSTFDALSKLVIITKKVRQRCLYPVFPSPGFSNVAASGSSLIAACSQVTVGLFMIVGAGCVREVW